MEPIQNTNTHDILAELEASEELVITKELWGQSSLENPMHRDILDSSSVTDVLGQTVAHDLVQSISLTPSVSIAPISLTAKAISHAKFVAHYVAVSTAVFAILLIATNWSAYWSIAANFIQPGGLEGSANQIEQTLSTSKISVFANAEGTLHQLEQKERAQDIKAQLDAEKVSVEEDPFSMRQLIPDTPSINTDFVITPYENRIIIPKIGKNIPLVDVAGLSGFDFEHMENIFMQELEKGVVRYPGTALPGEKGNAFIFGHSSNYPWVKGEYNEVFALLDHLEFGDQIIVYYNQKKFVYTIREKKVVRPGDVKALERDPEASELSLMTCWPIGTTLKRMLVFAELTKE
jgi:LPXTG-site transpeptidase (sortase) family protein